MKITMLVVQGRPKGKCLRFPTGEYLIGRGVECQVRPNSAWVSRQHCILRIDESAVHVRDLGSTNGTLVNGVRVIGERTLEEGDQLQVGPLVLELLASSPANEQLQPMRETDELPVDNASETYSDFDARQFFQQNLPIPPARKRKLV